MQNDGMRWGCTLLFVAFLVTRCAATPAQSAELPLHQYGYGTVASVALSRDGKRLLTGGYDGAAHLWDVTTAQHLHTFPIPYDPRTPPPAVGRPTGSLSLSADGSKVQATVYDTLTWDAATFQVLRSGVSGALSPDGTKLFSGPQLIDVATGNVIWTLPSADYYDAQAGSFSADGKKFVTYGTAKDNTYKVAQWDVATGQRLQEFALPPDLDDLFLHLNAYYLHFNAVALTRDGNKVLTGHRDKSLRLWDATSGALMGEFAGQPDEIYSVSLSDDGTRALAYGVTNLSQPMCAAPTGQESVHSVWLWDIVTSQTLKVFSHAGETPRGALFVGNRPLVFSSADDQAVHLWDLENDQIVQSFTGHTPSVRNAELSKDGTKLLTFSSDLKLRMWNTASEQMLWSRWGWGRFTPDGTKILSAGQGMSGELLLDASSGNILADYNGPIDAVAFLAFSGDGTKLLIASLYGGFRLLEFPSGKPLSSLPLDLQDCWGWQLSYDGMTVLAHNYSYATVWDVRTNALHLLPGINLDVNTSMGGTGAIMSTALSPDGSLALLNELPDDNTGNHAAVTLWDTRTGAQLSLYKHIWLVDGNFQSAVFSPTGRMGLIIYGSDVDQFTIRTDRQMKNISLPLALYAAAFSPDETKILTGGADGMTRLWKSADIKAGVRDWTGYR